MPNKIAIASGKGGTGKTTVSVNLYNQFKNTHGGKIILVDCDVEEPNDIIFFNSAVKKDELEISQLIPSIDKDKCTFCRKCSDYCEFNAIVVIPPVQFAEVNPSLCHSCGACLVACNQQAINEHLEPIGNVNFYEDNKGNNLLEGRLKIGSAMQTMLIKELKKKVPANLDVILFDAPPGTSCPVVETISDTDYIILVAEPTLFGLHDLKLMVQLVKEIEIPFGVIINKAGLGDNSIYDFIKQERIELLGEIPFSKEYAGLYAKGEIFDSAPEEILSAYVNIVNRIEKTLITEFNQ